MKNDFVEITQKIWNEPTFAKKKKLMLEMIDMFAVKGVGKFKIHSMKFKYAVETAKSGQEIDQIASNVFLSKDHKVYR